MKKKKRAKKPVRRPKPPNYDATCDVCGQTPVVPETGLCGPCTFGEADTAGGNW